MQTFVLKTRSQSHADYSDESSGNTGHQQDVQTILQRRAENDFEKKGNRAHSGEYRPLTTPPNQRTIQKKFAQPELNISFSDDGYEKEADHIAEMVMTMPEPEHWRGAFIRDDSRGGYELQAVQCKSSCETLPVENCNKKDDAPFSIHAILRSSGKPLEPTILSFMESRFGCDFQQVRVHSDLSAAESAHSINAQAYTTGNDIVFGAGQYKPETSTGRQLIAHELTHVIQQHGGERSGFIQRQVLIRSRRDVDNRPERLRFEINRPANLQGLTTAIREELVAALATAVRTPILARLGELNEALAELLTQTNGQAQITFDFAISWSDSNTVSGLSLNPVAVQPTIPPPDSSVAATEPESQVEGEPASYRCGMSVLSLAHYVDNFQNAIYDISGPRTDPTSFSSSLSLRYDDGSEFYINIHDIGDEQTVPASEMVADDFFYVDSARANRVFPRRLCRATVPNLWEAKRQALIVMSNANVEFITGTLPVILILIFPPMMRGGRSNTQRLQRSQHAQYRSARSLPNVPRASASTNAAALDDLARMRRGQTLPVGNPNHTQVGNEGGFSGLLRMSQNTVVAETQAVQTITATGTNFAPLRLLVALFRRAAQCARANGQTTFRVVGKQVNERGIQQAQSLHRNYGTGPFNGGAAPVPGRDVTYLISVERLMRLIRWM